MQDKPTPPPSPREKPLKPQERIQIWLPLLLAFFLALGIVLGFFIYLNTMSSRVVFQFGEGMGREHTNSKIEEVLNYVDAKYLEKVSRDELEESALRALLKQLDPHSSYISAEDMQGVNESLAGGFDGIGIEFFILNDTVHIVGIIPDGPSSKAGLVTGDKIIAVDDSLVAGVGISNKDLINKLKGMKDTEVELDVLRINSERIKRKIIRDEIAMRSVDLAYMLDDERGYIRISRFSNKTYKEFMEALQGLIDEHGMKDLVIDLRQNPGGYLDAATNILMQLFDKKRLLVYTEGRSYKRKEYFSNGKNFFGIDKIAVLIDEYSASASEIIAGAIQDNDRGIIVGRRSFGKGLVQEQYRLADGSGLRLTIAKYYTPSGRLIQKPYELDKQDEYEQDLVRRINSGELYSLDSLKFSDTVKYYTTGGRVVYGGGGIVPDIFVPFDSSSRNSFFIQASEHFAPFIYGYLDGRREYLKKYKSWEDFADYRIASESFAAFLAYCKEQGLESSDKAAVAAARGEIETYLKAYIGKQLFRDLGFYRSLHQKDQTLKRALEELRGRK